MGGSIFASAPAKALPHSGVDTRRSKRHRLFRSVVDIANVRAPAPLIDRDDRSARATTRAVDPMVAALDRHEVYRFATVEDGEVRQHASRNRVRPSPTP